MLILAGVAAYFIYRLISVLGARTGHEPRRDPEGASRAARSESPRDEAGADARTAPEPAPVSASARPLREADPAFDERAYLEGARAAYEMIIEAFATGDLRSIRRYLSDSVYEAFKSAVMDREAAGCTADVKFVGIESAAISESKAENGVLTAVTDFASNQVRVTRGRDGEVVEGDPNRIDLVKDRWIFSRKLSSADPNWVLVATGAIG